MMREVVVTGMAIVAMLATASAAPSASAAEAPAKDLTVTVRDPAAEPKKTVAALFGGSVKLFVPEYANTKKGAAKPDKTFTLTIEMK